MPPRAQQLVEHQQLRPLLVRSDRAGTLHLAGHLLVLAATTACVFLARGSWWIGPAWVLDGVVLAHLFALQHETAHGTAFRSRQANRIVTTACGAALGIAPRLFRLEHIAHHSNTQDPERDPELIGVPRSIPAWLWFVAGGPFWRYQLSTLIPHALGRLAPGEEAWLPASTRPAIYREVRLMLAGWLAAIVVPLLFGSDLVLVLWIGPRVVGEPIMRIARLSEHAGRPQVPDLTVNTRTLDVPAPLRWLAWNMPYHAEHHAAPAVPFHALPRLRPLLAGTLAPPAGGYLAAQRDILGKRCMERAFNG